MNFLHHFFPQPIIFQSGFIAIRWYGVFIVAAIILGLWLTARLAGKRGIKTDAIFDLAFWGVIGGIIGARGYDVFLIDWGYYHNHLLDVFKIWQGGLAIHGAIIGAVVALFWASRRFVIPSESRASNRAEGEVEESLALRNQRDPSTRPAIKQGSVGMTNKKWFRTFLILFDLITPALALGQAIGRWGNYFNQELFGGPTNLPWGIFIAPENRPASFVNAEYFHPAFLYESILDFVLFVVLFKILSCHSSESCRSRTTGESGNPVAETWDPRLRGDDRKERGDDRKERGDDREKNGMKKGEKWAYGGHNRMPGTATLIYLAGYSLIRFFTEFIRIDPTPTALGLRLPQWVSAGIFLGAMIVICKKNRWQNLRSK